MVIVTLECRDVTAGEFGFEWRPDSFGAAERIFVARLVKEIGVRLVRVQT